VLRRRLLGHIDLDSDLTDGARPSAQEAHDLDAPRLSEGTGTAAGFKAWIDFARGRALQPQNTAKKAAGRRPKAR
jgi:hypothetical protein